MIDQEFCIAPDLRRSCCWLIAATPFFILGGVVNFFLKHGIFPWTEWARMAPACLAVLLWVLVVSAPLFWRLRKTTTGIERRWYRGFDCWSWNDLASGRIEKLLGRGMIDRTRPWWRRTLNLACLSDTDFAIVMSAINEYYRLPPAGELSEKLVIGYGRRKLALLDAQGIHLEIHAKCFDYTWSDVRRLYMRRLDPVRRDFRSLLLLLPDHEVELQVRGEDFRALPIWNGSPPEEINDFLLQHVPSDKVEIGSVGESPNSRPYLEWRCRRMIEGQQLVKPLLWCLALVGGGIVLVAVLLGNNQIWKVVVPECSILAIAISLACWRDRRRLAQLRAKIESLP